MTLDELRVIESQLRASELGWVESGTTPQGRWTSMSMPEAGTLDEMLAWVRQVACCVSLYDGLDVSLGPVATGRVQCWRAQVMAVAEVTP